MSKESNTSNEHKEPKKWLASTVKPYMAIIYIAGVATGIVLGWFICINATYDAQAHVIELSKLKTK